jgi:signal transduction protein PmrD
MLISTLDTEKGIFMEWLVIDVIYLGKTSHYMLILHAGTLKMMSEVTSKSPIQPGDILYPVSNAMYLINKNENQRLKVTSAAAFSSTQWCFLKKSC